MARQDFAICNLITAQHPAARALCARKEPAHDRGVDLPATASARFRDPTVEAWVPGVGAGDVEVEWTRGHRVIEPDPGLYARLTYADPRHAERLARIGAKSVRRLRDLWGVVGVHVECLDPRGGYVIVPVVVPRAVAEVGPDGRAVGRATAPIETRDAARLPWAYLADAAAAIPGPFFARVADLFYGGVAADAGASSAIAEALALDASIDERVGLWEPDVATWRLPATRSVGYGVADVPKAAAALGMVTHAVNPLVSPPRRVRVPWARPVHVRTAPVVKPPPTVADVAGLEEALAVARSFGVEATGSVVVAGCEGFDAGPRFDADPSIDGACFVGGRMSPTAYEILPDDFRMLRTIDR